MSFPKYPKYQDTGLTWLAEVPEHWRVIAPKRVMKSCSGGTLIKGECAAEPEEGLFPAFSASGQDVWVERADYSSPGIVLSAVGARCGKTFKADGEWGVVANTHCLFPEGNQSRDFFWYLTNREDWWETGGTAQPFVKVRETLARTWCLPPANEQRCISNFLDRETAKIDGLIAEQQRLIDLLQEKRQAVISHAVTKGLNPNARMKDSGVEWLGEVPEHWELSRVKTISSFTTSGPRGWSEQISEDGALFVQSGDLNDSLGVDFEDCKRVRVSGDAEASRTRLQPGDAVVCITGAKTGNAAVCHELPEDSYINQHLCLIRPLKNIDPGFLGLLLKSHCGQTHFALAQYGLKQGLSLENVRDTPVVLPPMQEQVEIVSYVNKVRVFMRSLINESHHSIEVLKERRSALISAAVTGQIDVRGLVEAEAGEQ